jgi:hypothetical protein
VRYAALYRPITKAVNNDLRFYHLAFFNVKKRDISEVFKHTQSYSISRNCFVRHKATPHFLKLAVIDMRLQQIVVIRIFLLLMVGSRGLG